MGNIVCWEDWVAQHIYHDLWDFLFLLISQALLQSLQSLICSILSALDR